MIRAKEPGKYVFSDVGRGLLCLADIILGGDTHNHSGCPGCHLAGLPLNELCCSKAGGPDTGEADCSPLYGQGDRYIICPKSHKQKTQPSSVGSVWPHCVCSFPVPWYP